METRSVGSLALVLMLTFAACGSTGSDESSPLRIAASEWPGYDMIHLAAVEGLYAARGVDVDVVDMASIADAHRAFERGDVDGVAMTLAESLAVDPANRDYRTVLLLDYSDGADVIRAARGRTRFEDLKGRTVGVEWAPLGTQVLARALQKHGLGTDDVVVKYASPGELPDLLRDGLVDAIQTYPPYSSKLAEEGFPIVFSSVEIPGEITDVVAFGTDVIEERRADIERFVATWTDVLDYVDHDEAGAMNVMADREGVGPDEFAESWEGVRLLTLAEQLEAMRDGSTERVCRSIGAVFVEAGLADAAAGASDCKLDASILEAVLG